MWWGNPCPPEPCQPYQPLPISTGTIGYDRCGNVEVYAAPATVKAPVGWACWPIQCQQPGWPPGPAWGGTPGYPGTPGWGGGWDWWWWLWPMPVDPGFTAPPWWGPWSSRSVDVRSLAQTRGTEMANWMINVRNTLKATPR